MLSALLGAALVFIPGIAAPLGLEPRAAMSYADALALARSAPGKAFLFAVVSLFAWHGMHRIYHTLHDLGVPGGLVAKLGCYGLALLVTLRAAYALLAIGS
jgi:fumarate reductase subunit D